MRQTTIRDEGYFVLAVPDTPPLSPIRTLAEDWSALDDDERIAVNLYVCGLLLSDDLSTAGATFVRRHHPRSMES